tara:strand:+ start:776 stop:1447 length:672 start_codon:yes stop_codon:yes gene_type:complete
MSCPRCGSKDNLAEYDDHVWCFGCKYHKTKDDVNSLRSRIHKIDSTKGDLQVLDTVREIPRKAMQWLLSYGISQEEINEYGIKWSPKQDLLVLVDRVDYWQGRCFGVTNIKYRSHGNKPLTIYGQGDILILVEDVLSAIKIARLRGEFCASPLLGSSLSYAAEKQLIKTYKKIYVWLDRDKAVNAIRIKNKLKGKGITSKAIVTPLDPKEYSKGELAAWLKNK